MTEDAKRVEALTDALDDALDIGQYAMGDGPSTKDCAAAVIAAGWVSPEEATAREAAARREELLEAIERIEGLAGDYANGGQTLSWQGARHCVETLIEEEA